MKNGKSARVSHVHNGVFNGLPPQPSLQAWKSSCKSKINRVKEALDSLNSECLIRLEATVQTVSICHISSIFHTHTELSLR